MMSDGSMQQLPGRPDQQRNSAPVRLGLAVHVLLSVLGGALIAFGAFSGLWWALGSPDLATTPAALSPEELLSVLRIALTVVAGIGGIVALVVALRRQRFVEIDHTRAVAADKREDTRLFTERFRSATEQIGSDKAAVRLAGLYALRELGDDWPTGRQMCADVICAYLRMPFGGPYRVSQKDRDESDESKLEEPARAVGEQELQVRITAQRLISSRLPGIDPIEQEPMAWTVGLDLAGAHLIDVDFSERTFHKLTCDGATFHGRADFHKAVFMEEVGFSNVTFRDKAVFSGAVFALYAGFSGSSMLRGTYFVGAKFEIDGEFHSCLFRGETAFDKARAMTGRLYFIKAKFDGTVRFRDTDFGSDEHPERVFLGATVSDRTRVIGLPKPWELENGSFVIPNANGAENERSDG
jgi:hypothetical protein